MGFVWWVLLLGRQIFCVILQFFGNSQKQEQKAKSKAFFKKQLRATI